MIPDRVVDLKDYKSSIANPLPSGDGGGTFDGMEARVAKLESTSEHILRELAEMKTDIRELRKDGQRDFRILFGALIAAAVGLAGLMAKGFHWF